MVASMYRFGACIFLGTVCPWLMAQTLNVFGNGEVADADKINENFQAIEERISAHHYEISLASDGIFNRRVSKIDHNVFVELCGDLTGCEFRLCNYSFVTGSTALGLPQCKQGQISYDQGSGRWAAGRLTFIGDSLGNITEVGTDNDGAFTLQLDFGFCALSDADTFSLLDLALSDDSIGMGLVYVAPNDNSSTNHICSLVSERLIPRCLIASTRLAPLGAKPLL